MMVTALVLIAAWLASGYAAARIVDAIAHTADGRRAGLDPVTSQETVRYVAFGFIIFVPIIIAVIHDVWEARR